MLQEPAAPPAPTAATQASYLDVPYPKFVSGIYVDQFKGKYVRIKCTYYSVAAGEVPGGFSPDRYFAFNVIAPPNSGLVPGGLTVVAPKELADTVFALKYGQAIVVSGKAVEVLVSQTNGKSYRSLVLEAQKIEKTK